MILFSRAQAADFELRQYHNQPDSSSLHRQLVRMWKAVESETGGRVRVRTYAANNNLAGGDPAAFQMLLSGELAFFTLMGGLIANLVPAADVQGIPFAFRSPRQVYAAMDADLGEYLRGEMRAKGIYAFPRGCFENGMRHISLTGKPIQGVADMQGLKIRVPNGEIFSDFFRSLGAMPVGVNANGIYAAVKAGRVQAQENPLAVVELFKLYEVQRYVSLTGHMWSGFNLLANLKVWERFPPDVRDILERNVAKYAAVQRTENDNFAGEAQSRLIAQGMRFNMVDTSGFRARLGGFYARWRTQVGEKAWTLLEKYAGRIA